MGGSSDTKQSPPIIPGWLKPLLGEEANQYGTFGGFGPSLLSLYGNMPQLSVPDLNGEQNKDIDFLQQIANNPGHMTGNEMAASQEYKKFLGGPNQPSEATRAALSQFNQLQAPELQQQAELMGQGNSGAALAAEAQGRESALVPFMQQDLQNQFGAAQGLESLGGMQEQNIQNALGGQNMRYSIMEKKAQSLFDRMMEQEKFGANIQTQPFSLLSQSIGGGSTVQTQPKF